MIGFYILILYPTTYYNHLLIPEVFDDVWNFHRQLCHLGTKAVLLFPSQHVYFLSPFLVL